MRRRTIPAVCGLLLAAGVSVSAWAESVRMKNGIIYEPVRIVNVANGFVSFQFPPGRRELLKPLSEVAGVTLDGNADYNRAETLLGEGKHSQALAAFQAAEKAARKGWEKTLIGYRLLVAADAAGQIEEAVKRWLAIVDQTEATAQSLELCPKNPAAGGSKENDRAIALLEAKAKQADSKEYLRQIQRLLVDLYARQGRTEDARVLAAKLAGVESPTTGPGQPDPSQQTTPTAASRADLLKAAALSLQSGRHDEVVNLLKGHVESMPAAELPTALCLLGKAQLGAAKADPDADAARGLLLESGLNLMRVVAFFPEAEEAPEALLAAGEVNEQLSNVAAARAAYGLLLERHQGSAQAKQAGQRLEKLSEPKE